MPPVAGAKQCLVAALFACVTCSAWAVPEVQSATALRDQYTRLTEQLGQNPFGRPLVLQSVETATRLSGDIYAVMAYTLKEVSTGLGPPEPWCEVMILHINTKYCHAIAGPRGTALRVYVGKKTPQNLADATRLEFQYQQAVSTQSYFTTTLNARDGPLSTHDYRIRLEAVALPGNQTFLHLSYSYAVGFVGRVAMQSYLATAGADKVGFTEMATLANGQTELVGGVRGVIERNVMRYFLAVDSYLASVKAPPSEQLEQRLQGWFTAVAHYPRQLHEMDRPAYLEMKRAEHTRQQTVF